MFPEDFKSGEILKKIEIFFDEISKSNTFEMFKDFAIIALKIQKKIIDKDPEAQARYYDLVSLAFELEGNYKEAYFYQKDHLLIWHRSEMGAINKKKWKFKEDIDYSMAQILKFACLIKLEGEEDKLVRKCLESKGESNTNWIMQLKVFQSIFLLKNENEEEKQEGFSKAEELLKELNIKIESIKVQGHPYFFNIVDILENIFQSKFCDQEFINRNIRQKPLFSFLNFEMENGKFLEECHKVYAIIKN